MHARFVSCGVGVYMYLYSALVACVVVCGAGGLYVIDIYNGLFRLCLRLCVSIG